MVSKINARIMWTGTHAGVLKGGAAKTVTKMWTSACLTHVLMVVPVLTGAQRMSAIAPVHILATTARMLSRSALSRQFLQWVRTVAIPRLLNAQWSQPNQLAHALAVAKRTMGASHALK
jgi:hypothetical protein